MTDMTSDEIANYAERATMYRQFEKAANDGKGIVFLRQLVSHLTNDEIHEVLVFHHVNALKEAPSPARELGTFWTPEEVPEYLGDMWGQWVG